MYGEEIYTRKFWCESLYKIAYPILSLASKGELRNTLIFDTPHHRKIKVGYLEAIARTFYGISGWLNLKEDEIENEQERTMHKEMLDLAQKTIANIVDPKHPEYCKFHGVTLTQPIVDCAFLASALIDAKEVLYDAQTDEVKKNIITALKKSASIRPIPTTNWLLFPAIIETCLYVLTGKCNKRPIDYSLKKFESWYVGDGFYCDGEKFAFDYYNSFVIHPMLEQITRNMSKQNLKYSIWHRREEQRLDKYVLHLEKFIAPDGTYAACGRSITYRTGAFNALAKSAYRKILPSELCAGQVRNGLSLVLAKMMSAKTLFDEKGFLNVGLFGEGRQYAQSYINKGSVYLCSAVFAPLGLPSNDEFWTCPISDISWVKCWS